MVRAANPRPLASLRVMFRASAARRPPIKWKMYRMARKSPPKPKLTDAERHKRFVEMAREIEASEDAEAFDQAFDKVTRKTTSGKEKDS
jgi:hypothetical protein